jgi:hypothetical protein
MFHSRAGKAEYMVRAQHKIDKCMESWPSAFSYKEGFVIEVRTDYRAFHVRLLSTNDDVELTVSLTPALNSNV